MPINITIPQRIIKAIKENWIFLLIYLFFFYVASRSPVGGDDWEIATWYRNGAVSSFIGNIRTWAYFNGRVFNNLFDAMFSFYRGLWVVISPLAHAGTLYFISKTLKYKNNTFAVLVTFVMLLCVSIDMRAQIHFHTVANISYTFPICIIFFYIYLINRDISGHGMVIFSSKRFNGAIYSVLALTASLWIENLTIGFMAVLLVYLVKSVTKKTSIPLSIKCGLIGGFIGTAFMFSSIGISARIGHNISIVETITKNYKTVLDDLVNSSLLMYAIYALIAIWAIKCGIIALRKPSKIIMMSFFSAITTLIILKVLLGLLEENSFLFTANANRWINTNVFSLSGKNIVPVSISILLLFSMFVPITCVKDTDVFIPLYIMAIFSAIPMVLSPGARNMMLSQYVLIALVGYLASKITFRKSDYKKLALILVTAMLLIRMENYAFYLEEAQRVTKFREALISEYKADVIYANGASGFVLLLPKYREDVFIPNLQSDYYIESIKNYYDLPKESIIHFVD